LGVCSRHSGVAQLFLSLFYLIFQGLLVLLFCFDAVALFIFNLDKNERKGLVFSPDIVK